MGSPGARRLAALLLTLGRRGCQGTPSQEQAARFDAYGPGQGYADAGDFDRARRPLASALEINDRAWRPQLIVARIYDAGFNAETPSPRAPLRGGASRSPE